MNKAFQKRVMQGAGFAVPNYATLTRQQWLTATPDQQKTLFDQIQQKIGLPMVVKSANQRYLSIGVSTVKHDNIADFNRAVLNSLFIKDIDALSWRSLSPDQRKDQIRQISDLRTGIGLPLHLSLSTKLQDTSAKPTTVYLPSDLLHELDRYC